MTQEGSHGFNTGLLALGLVSVVAIVGLVVLLIPMNNQVVVSEVVRPNAAAGIAPSDTLQGVTGRMADLDCDTLAYIVKNNQGTKAAAWAAKMYNQDVADGGCVHD